MPKPLSYHYHFTTQRSVTTAIAPPSVLKSFLYLLYVYGISAMNFIVLCHEKSYTAK